MYACRSDTTYLIPVLLDTSFCPAGKCLLNKFQSMTFTFPCSCSHTWTFHTLAISAQLLPASLIVFSLCSSAAVHGVLVRLFLAGGCIGADGVSGSAMLDEGPAAGAMGLDEVGPEARRFTLRGLAGCNDSCFGELSGAAVLSTG
jgi:hypothetical protein